MPFFFFDTTMVLLIPAFLLAMWAQMKVKSAYAKYAEIGNRRGLSGADVAQLILRDAGIDMQASGNISGPACSLECVPGNLTDHYDPTSKTLRLSEAVYHGRSIAAVGIAAHEVGHAIQHARMYAPLGLRSVLYPISSFGSTLAWPLFFIGFFFRSGIFLQAGIVLFTFAVLFTLITLPVEFNASKRALRALTDGRYLEDEELLGARKVLGAAAMTYVASAVMAITQLLRMVLLSNSRD